MAESVKGVNADWPDELEATRANLRAMADAVELQKDEIERLRAANDKLHGLLADIQDGCVVDSEGVVYVMDDEKVGEAIETYIALAATEKT